MGKDTESTHPKIVPTCVKLTVALLLLLLLLAIAAVRLASSGIASAMSGGGGYAPAYSGSVENVTVVVALKDAESSVMLGSTSVRAPNSSRMLSSSRTTRRGELPGTVTLAEVANRGSSLLDELDDELDDDDELRDELEEELDDGGVLGLITQIARLLRVHVCEKM
jgi:hypothetical protein